LLEIKILEDKFMIRAIDGVASVLLRRKNGRTQIS